MKTFFLSFPRLEISLKVPDEIISDIKAAFLHSIRPGISLIPRHEYVIQSTPTGFSFLKNGQLAGQFGSSLETLCNLEEEIEVTLTQAIGNWVTFHAGAVEIDGFACLIAGDPDTGKTTTTFNLIEMGQIFLCEEISPVDPETLLIHPYPQVLTMSRELKLFDSDMARYRPFKAGKKPVPLKVILLPVYNPSCTPGIEELSPGEVYTELLGYCFPPNRDEEHLFDSVIRICEESRIFRVLTNNIRAMRELMKELFGPNPEP
jgi:hypothetical protein